MESLISAKLAKKKRGRPAIGIKRPSIFLRISPDLLRYCQTYLNISRFVSDCIEKASKAIIRKYTIGDFKIRRKGRGGPLKTESIRITISPKAFLIWHSVPSRKRSSFASECIRKATKSVREAHLA